MPHELPGWAIYVVIGLAVLCFAFLVAWMNERKEAKRHLATCFNIASILQAENIECVTLEGKVQELVRNLSVVEGAKRSKEAAIESLIGTNEIYAKQINNVKAFVRDRQLTLRPKKGKLFVAFNEPELEKVMNGEEIA